MRKDQTIWLLICGILLAGCGAQIAQVEVKKPLSINEINSVKTIAITAVVPKLARGEDVGVVQTGVLCRDGKTLRWSKNNQLELQNEEFINLFQHQLTGHGWPVTGSTEDLIEGYDISSADILVAAKIIQLEAKLCYPYSRFGNYASKGSMLITVEWQVYDRRKQATVARLSTNGSAVIDKAFDAASHELTARSFSAAVQNLLSMPAFKTLAEGKEAGATLIRTTPIRTTPIQGPYIPISGVFDAKQLIKAEIKPL